MCSFLAAFFTSLAEHHGGYKLWSERPPGNTGLYLWQLPRRERRDGSPASGLEVAEAAGAPCPPSLLSEGVAAAPPWRLQLTTTWSAPRRR